MRARWTAEGIPKKETDRMEAKSLLEILQCMPVFVMQNGESITSRRCSFELSVGKSILTRSSATSATMATGSKPKLARKNAVEQPMRREWWAALWKEEMTGIGTVGKVIGGAPIDPHLGRARGSRRSKHECGGRSWAGGRGRSCSLIVLRFL
jgi:hypothetical protein